MAVTVLEASAARVVGQYLPVSRIRPLRELIDLVGAEFCRDHLVRSEEHTSELQSH